MKFGPVPVRESEGAILAHSISAGSKRLRKGRRLGRAEAEALEAAGLREVVVAVLEDSDVGEDAAADRIAKALLSGTDGLVQSAPFTGRVNLYAERPGLVEIDADAVFRINSIDPAVTLATLPDLARVGSRIMAATIKIITYGVAERCVEAAVAESPGAIRFRDVEHRDAGLVLTEAAGQKGGLAEKGRRAILGRLDALGIGLAEIRIAPHEPEAVGNALSECRGSILLLLTGSATSDPDDVGPAGLRLAGGDVRRFGIPVDPGNLLFHGELSGRPVIGLPGCARSPALNGADWVLERIACGMVLADSDFAAMGAGGLLKEIPVRPQPRAASRPSARPSVEVLVFGEGSDSLAAVRSALESSADRVHAVDPAAGAGLPGLPAGANPVAVDGQAGQDAEARAFRAVLSALGESADAAMLVRGSGPAPSAAQLDRLIAAFSPADGREIACPSVESLRGGGPVLIGRRFFEALAALDGFEGIRGLVSEQGEFAVETE